MADPSAAVQTQKENEPIIPPTILKSSTLYVGDLPQTVNESAIYNIFVKENITGILSIRVCRDINTRNSLGYAYVNFEDETKAEQALELLRSPKIAGKPCRISWSIRDPSIRKSNKGNIFIKNLEGTISNDDLYHLFLDFIKEQKKIELEQTGVNAESVTISDNDVKDEILSCKVATDRIGKSKGYGFVHFARVDLAEKAKKKFDGLAFNQKIVYVGDFISRKDRPARNEDNFTNVYIKEIDKETVKTNEDLENLFVEFGEITSAKLMTDENNSSKGFGFVNFESHESALKAIEGRRNYSVNGKALYVAKALSRAERDKELEQKKNSHFSDKPNTKAAGLNFCNLYVKNLVDKIDDAKLRELFNEFGAITSAKVMVNENGISKGFGFVCFASTEEANNAINQLDKKIVDGKPLYVAIAQPRSERRRQLDSLHAHRANPRSQGMVPGYGPYPPVFPPYRVPFPAGAPMYHQLGYPVQSGFRGQPNRGRLPHLAGVGRGGMAMPDPRRDISELLRNKDPQMLVRQLGGLANSKRSTLDPQVLAQVENLIKEIEKEVTNGGEPGLIDTLVKQAFGLLSDRQH